MATLYTTLEGVVRSATQKAVVTPPAGGGVCKIVPEYEASATTDGDTLNVATIPAYSKWRLKEFNYDALGAGTSLDFGYSGHLTDQLSGLDTHAAAVSPATEGGWRYVSADTDLLATLHGAMTGTLQFEIEYFRSGTASGF